MFFTKIEIRGLLNQNKAYNTQAEKRNKHKQDKYVIPLIDPIIKNEESHQSKRIR